MSVTIYRDEIKNVLDSNPQFREMLFKRGYLLSDGAFDMNVYPFYGEWAEVEIGRYRLYVQQKQTCYSVTRSGLTAVIVGHAYNPFDMKFNEDDLCSDLIDAYQKGLPEYFDKISEFTGLHVILLFDKDQVIACQDACALTGCYFGKINGVTCVAEHPQLIADLFDLKMDSMVEKLVQSKCYNIGNRYLPGNVTPYKELKRLGGNTYLTITDRFQIKRFYPTAPHPEFKTEEEKAAGIAKIGNLIHKGIACCAEKWDRCAISLSGGTDSKTTLACANGLYDKYTYFSYHSKPQELVDAKGAMKLCKDLGLEHTFYPIPQNNEDIPNFEFIKKILQHNTSYFVNLADHEIRKYIFLHDLDAYDIELKSWASEVARVFLERKYEIKMPETLNERQLSIFQTRFFGHPKLMRWCDREYYRFLREVGLEKPLFNFEHTDLFYWEIRMGCWGVSVTSSQQLFHRISMPMNNRKILELFLCFPHEERKTDSVHKRVMAYENQAVVDANVEIPNLYFHGYRIWMEKLFYLWRTISYRPKK